jgi:hypothetical protein
MHGLALGIPISVLLILPSHVSLGWKLLEMSIKQPLVPRLSLGMKTNNLCKTKAEKFNGSFLHDLACVKCRTLLGLQCDSAPEGHLLKECVHSVL